MYTTKALKKLAILVKNSRATLGMSQREYSNLMRDCHPSISNLEKANFIDLPNHSTLIQLAKILRMPYWELIKKLEEEEDPTCNLPEPLTVEEIIAAISNLNKMNDLLKVHWVLSQKIEKLR